MLGHPKRAGHYRPTAERRLTARQEQVLDLIARGRTNPEIAEALGLSLDGAKWHVREIMARLEANSREEAVAIWQARKTPGKRSVRILGPIFALQNLARLGIASLAVGGAAAVGAAAIVTWPHEDDAPPPASIAPATATTEPTPTVETIPTAPSEAVVRDLVARMEECLKADYPLPTPVNGFATAGYIPPLVPIVSASRAHRIGPCAQFLRDQTGLVAPEPVLVDD